MVPLCRELRRRAVHEDEFVAACEFVAANALVSAAAVVVAVGAVLVPERGVTHCLVLRLARRRDEHAVDIPHEFGGLVEEIVEAGHDLAVKALEAVDGSVELEVVVRQRVGGEVGVVHVERGRLDHELDGDREGRAAVSEGDGQGFARVARGDRVAFEGACREGIRRREHELLVGVRGGDLKPAAAAEDGRPVEGEGVEHGEHRGQPVGTGLDGERRACQLVPISHDLSRAELAAPHGLFEAFEDELVESGSAVEDGDGHGRAVSAARRVGEVDRHGVAAARERERRRVVLAVADIAEGERREGAEHFFAVCGRVEDLALRVFRLEGGEELVEARVHQRIDGHGREARVIDGRVGHRGLGRSHIGAHDLDTRVAGEGVGLAVRGAGEGVGDGIVVAALLRDSLDGGVPPPVLVVAELDIRDIGRDGDIGAGAVLEGELEVPVIAVRDDPIDKRLFGKSGLVLEGEARVELSARHADGAALLGVDAGLIEGEPEFHRLIDGSRVALIGSDEVAVLVVEDIAVLVTLVLSGKDGAVRYSLDGHDRVVAFARREIRKFDLDVVVRVGVEQRIAPHDLDVVVIVVLILQIAEHFAARSPGAFLRPFLFVHEVAEEVACVAPARAVGIGGVRPDVVAAVARRSRQNGHGQIDGLLDDDVGAYAGPEEDVAVHAGVALEADLTHELLGGDIGCGLLTLAVPHGHERAVHDIDADGRQRVAALRLLYGERPHGAVRELDADGLSEEVLGIHVYGLRRIRIEGEIGRDLGDDIAVNEHGDGMRLSDEAFIGIPLIRAALAVEHAGSIEPPAARARRLAAAEPSRHPRRDAEVEVVARDIAVRVLDRERVYRRLESGEIPLRRKLRFAVHAKARGDRIQPADEVEDDLLILADLTPRKQRVEVERDDGRAVRVLDEGRVVAERRRRDRSHAVFDDGDIRREGGLGGVAPAEGEFHLLHAAVPAEGGVVPRELAHGEPARHPVTDDEISDILVGHALVELAVHFHRARGAVRHLDKIRLVGGIDGRSGGGLAGLLIGDRHALVAHSVKNERTARRGPDRLIAFAGHGILQRLAEEIAHVVLESDADDVGQRGGVRPRRVESELLRAPRAVRIVVVDISLDGGHGVIVGQIDGHDRHDFVERVAVDMTRKTQSVLILGGFGRRHEIDGRGVPDDVDALRRTRARITPALYAVRTDIGRTVAGVVDDSHIRGDGKAVALGEQSAVEHAAPLLRTRAVGAAHDRRGALAGIADEYARGRAYRGGFDFRETEQPLSLQRGLGAVLEVARIDGEHISVGDVRDGRRAAACGGAHGLAVVTLVLGAVDHELDRLDARSHDLVAHAVHAALRIQVDVDVERRRSHAVAHIRERRQQVAYDIAEVVKQRIQQTKETADAADRLPQHVEDQPLREREGHGADIGLEHIDLLLHERLALRLGGVALCLYRLQFPEQVGDDVHAPVVAAACRVAPHCIGGIITSTDVGAVDEVPGVIVAGTAPVDAGAAVHRAALGARALQQTEDHGVEIDEQLVVRHLVQRNFDGDELRGIGARAGSGAARYVRHVAAVSEEVEFQLLDYAFERGGDVVAGIGVEAPLIAAVGPAGGVGGHRGGGGFRAALLGSGGSLSCGSALGLRPHAGVRALSRERGYERFSDETRDIDDAEVLGDPCEQSLPAVAREQRAETGDVDIVLRPLIVGAEPDIYRAAAAVSARDIEVEEQTTRAVPVVVSEPAARVHGRVHAAAVKRELTELIPAADRVITVGREVLTSLVDVDVEVDSRGVDYVLQHGHDARRIGHGKPAVAFADFFDHFLDLGVGDETAESEFDVAYRELQARAGFVEDRVDGEGLDARVAEVELEAERLDVGDVARDLAADHAEEEFDDALFEFDADGVVGEVDGEAEAADVEPAFGAFGRAFGAFGAFGAFRGLVRCRGAFRHDIIDAARRAAEQTRYAGQLDRAEAEAAEVDIDGIRERARGVHAKSVVVVGLAQPRRAEIVRLEQAAVEVGQADIQH